LLDLDSANRKLLSMTVQYVQFSQQTDTVWLQLHQPSLGRRHGRRVKVRDRPRLIQFLLAHNVPVK